MSVDQKPVTSTLENDVEQELYDEEVVGFGVPQPISPCPKNRPQEIHDIVETVDRYNPENLILLQMYTEQQLEHDIYDRDACFAVLKLFQFNSGITNINVVCDVLTLALSALPSSDFNLALYLLEPETFKHPQVQQLIKLNEYLEKADFVSFWDFLKIEPVELEEKYRSSVKADDKNRRQTTHISPRKSTIERYPMFVEKIRRYISSTLSIAYQSLNLSLLSHKLGFINTTEFETAKTQIKSGKITDAQVVKRMGDCESVISKFELSIISSSNADDIEEEETIDTTNVNTESFSVWIRKDKSSAIELDPLFVSKELEIKISSLNLDNTNQQRLQLLQQETVKFENLSRIIESSKLIKA